MAQQSGSGQQSRTDGGSFPTKSKFGGSKGKTGGLKGTTKGADGVANTKIG